MSSERGTRRTSRLALPAEMKLAMLDFLNPIDRINLAIALPDLFWSPGFDIFTQDAIDQVARNRRKLRTPLVESEHMRPLLYAAIEHHVELEFIRKIVETYKVVCPSSINGIWGDAPAVFLPPLSAAASLGETRVVSMLLDEGADYSMKHSARWRYEDALEEFGAVCVLEGSVHTKCQLDSTVPHEDVEEIVCITAIDHAIHAVSEAGWGPNCEEKRQNLEDCALILMDRGSTPIGSIPYIVDAFPPMPMLPRLMPPAGSQELEPIPGLPMSLIEAGFHRVVQKVIEQMLSTDPTLKESRPFSIFIFEALKTAICFQFDDSYLDMVKYLLSLDGPLHTPQPAGQPVDFNSTAALLPLFRGRWKTCALVLDAYRRRRIALRFTDDMFEDLRRAADDDHCLDISHIKFLYHELMKPGIYVGNEESRLASVHKLHEVLLVWAIRLKEVESVRFLVEKGIGTPRHLNIAINLGQIEPCKAMVKAGVSVHEPATSWCGMLSPLELAEEHWDHQIARVLKGEATPPESTKRKAKEIDDLQSYETD